MILIIDNYDSFTFNLVQYFRQLDDQVIVRRNDQVDMGEIDAAPPKMIVISPGPGRPEDARQSIEVVQRWIGQLPILGICLGHQVISHVLGARIVKAIRPMHGKIQAIQHTGTGVFQGLKNPLQVTRYHSLVVERDSLPDCLDITAWTEAGEIMGFKHRDLMVEGLQFHPEAILTEHGMDMLANFHRRACQPW
jgi:anthranilate synthase/aminodeoxychorismate synthase-like glutamine amidotransferase